MNVIISTVTSMSQWARSYLDEISLSIIAVLLMMFGSQLSRYLRKRLSSLNSFLRSLLLITLCLIFSGLAIIVFPSYLHAAISSFNNQTLFPVLLIILCLLGVLADKNN
ncbi:DUF3392 family protein [Zooshikella harenae]|uniref:DUF3392 family protein n=1 Tax=Zooshikella harenae TaxID=2827238 RepID=A0ABS5Z651_9GAMM|nr:DUF3392 family protein [Zooshikella harenae]MBU2709524.1 DUF3392 family protein [Zooshikella harenae]